MLESEPQSEHLSGTERLCLDLEDSSYFDCSRKGKSQRERRESCVLNGLVCHMSGPSLQERHVDTWYSEGRDCAHYYRSHIHHREAVGIKARGTRQSASGSGFNKRSADTLTLKSRNSPRPCGAGEERLRHSLTHRCGAPASVSPMWRTEAPSVREGPTGPTPGLSSSKALGRAPDPCQEGP